MKGSSVLALVGLLAVGAGAGCGKKEGAPGGPPGGPPGAGRGGPGARGPMKFPVQVEQVTAREVEYAVNAVGSVEAFEKVQVTSRVQGVVEKVSFAEGFVVKKDQVLADIEPLRFKLQVDAAQAALDKALAERDEAKAALARREAVQKDNPGLLRGEELEAHRTRARTTEAEADARRVALEQAKLNLRDAYVRAPVAGVMETRSVQTGQYVQPGAVLGTLIRRDPMLVRFRVPQADAGRLETGMEARFRTRDALQPFTARITHVGQAADERSRMVELTAEVTDERRVDLRPGTFAEVTVPVAAKAAPVIPQTAIRPSERGFLAYVVEGETARERVVELGMRTADGRVEVRSGLSEGETLVVRGSEALREGAQVRVAPGPGEAAPAREGALPGPQKGGARATP
jgi:multidrug efflux system membrane fusion protein